MIAIYVRVSTEEQGKKGYSVRNQIQMCKDKAGTNDVIQYVDEGFSGEFLERPDLERLRKDVREGLITKVVCYDPDRLSRKLMNALIIDDEFRKKDVEMIYVNGEFASTPEGQLFYSLRGAISEFEKAKINERMTSGRKRKAIEGKVIKNSHAYGYDYDKENGMYVVNEKEANIIRFIFDMFTKPTKDIQGMNGIAKFLTAKEIPTKKGVGVWHRQVVRQILLNEMYTGTYYQNKFNTEGMLANKYKADNKIKMTIRDQSEWIETAIPQIIVQEQFDYAQELLKQARRRWSKSTSARTYLLSGIVRCADCGNTMTGIYRNNWGTKLRYYTDVKNSSGAKNEGCKHHVRADKLETTIWDKIEELLNNPERLEDYKPESGDTFSKFEIDQIDDLKEQIDKAKSGRKKLLQLFALEDMDTEEIRDSIVELKSKEERLKNQLIELEGKVNNQKEVSSSFLMLDEVRKRWLKEDTISEEDKKEILRMLVKEIILSKDGEISIQLL
ncbi:hypothetical protein JCM19047_4457 [Bacillus sp. JCM 19047]|nr:hypothetical protein JCM19047_4457 [Bacillus sp. JCM 19047]